MACGVAPSAKGNEVVGEFGALACVRAVMHVEVAARAAVLAEPVGSRDGGRAAPAPASALEVAAVLALTLLSRRSPPLSLARLDVSADRADQEDADDQNDQLWAHVDCWVAGRRGEDALILRARGSGVQIRWPRQTRASAKELARRYGSEAAQARDRLRFYGLSV